jgi:hypothetical protein
MRTVITYVICFSNNSQRYQRRPKKVPLGSVTELPEDAERQNLDATARCEIASNDREQRQLLSARRLTAHDVPGSHRTYDGLIRPQDISGFSYESLLNPDLAEFRGTASEPFIRRRRLASLGIVPGLRGYDENDWTDEHVHPATKAVQHFDEVAAEHDLRRSKRQHHLPTLIFTPESRFAETVTFRGGLWPSPFDDDWRSICFGSARSYRSASAADADDAEDGRSSTTSSLSDVSALQRIYGPRFSAASRLTLTSGKTIGSALRGDENYRLMSRNSSNVGSRTSTPQCSHETGRFKLFTEFQHLDIEQAEDANLPHQDGGNGETADGMTPQTAHRSSGGAVSQRKKKRKKKNRNCVFVRGEISRSFVYSYFTLLPGIERGKAGRDNERQKAGVKQPAADDKNQTPENAELIPSKK